MTLQESTPASPWSFNPVVGFLAVSTLPFPTRVNRGVRVSIPSWVFWLSRPLSRSSRRGDCLVSIPSWVFWLSRQQEWLPRSTTPSSFNPVVGFLAVSTCLVDALELLDVPFQSRRGFSGRLDSRIFISSDKRRRVSIPSWVFWPSRPTSLRRTARRSSFNPVVGFLAVSTDCRGGVGRLSCRFQSRRGFSGRLDSSRTSSASCSSIALFQSRRGFSGRLDFFTR